MSNEKNAAQMPQKKEKDDFGVSYEVGSEKITLSFATVKNYLVRGNVAVSDQEVVLFMQWCKYNLLNPWDNEAYLIKYDSTKPAQNVTGKAAFERRAEEHPDNDGYRAGLILVRDKEVIEVEGSFALPTDTILGGWCEVYRKGRKFPVVSKVNFDEYNKNQSTWKQIPKTMIRKVAIVQALREAFPKKLGSLYTEEEFQEAEVIEPEKEVQKEIEMNANKKPVKFEPDIAPTQSSRHEQQEEMIIMGDEGSGQVELMGPEF